MSLSEYLLHFYHKGGARKGRIDTVEKLDVRIGRAPDCDVRFDPRQDILVSGHHARVVFEGAHFFLYDDNSMHGTFLNGERIKAPRKLVSRDTIQLGEGGPRLRVYYGRDVKKCPVCENPVYAKHIVCPRCERKICLMCMDHASMMCKQCRDHSELRRKARKGRKRR